jgi:hypothetical protein
MTSRTHKTAQGKTIDLGQLILQNETVRAVGNMNVNARGDRLDSSNRVIDTKNQQVQRQHQRQISNTVVTQTVHTSNIHARKTKNTLPEAETLPKETVPTDTPTTNTSPIDLPSSGGGLAAAIAKSRTVVQEKEKTPRELKQFKPGVNRI